MDGGGCAWWYGPWPSRRCEGGAPWPTQAAGVCKCGLRRELEGVLGRQDEGSHVDPKGLDAERVRRATCGVGWVDRVCPRSAWLRVQRRRRARVEGEDATEVSSERLGYGQQWERRGSVQGACATATVVQHWAAGTKREVSLTRATADRTYQVPLTRQQGARVEQRGRSRRGTGCVCAQRRAGRVDVRERLSTEPWEWSYFGAQRACGRACVRACVPGCGVSLPVARATAVAAQSRMHAGGSPQDRTLGRQGDAQRTLIRRRRRLGCFLLLPAPLLRLPALPSKCLSLLREPARRGHGPRYTIRARRYPKHPPTRTPTVLSTPSAVPSM